MARARSIIVSRKHALKMARAVDRVAHHLREISGVVFVLGEGKLRPGADNSHLLMRMHEVLQADAEDLARMKVFLGHLLHQEVPPKAKMIGDGTSASR